MSDNESRIVLLLSVKGLDVQRSVRVSEGYYVLDKIFI